MKIEVTLASKRKDYIGAIHIKYITVRVPSDIKVLNMSAVWKIIKDRKDRLKVIKDYWESKPENQNKVWQGDTKDYYPLAWSPIITTDALNFISDNF